MSARAKPTEPITATLTSAARRAREMLNVFISRNPLMSWSCRKAACVDPRQSGGAAANGAGAPFRPDFEADVREAGGRDRRARRHCAGPPFDRTEAETDARC